MIPRGSDSRRGPDRYLAAAERMLSGTDTVGAFAVSGGWWPKACACLVRLALEAGLEVFWRRVSPPVAATSGRTKLLMLRRRTSREVAGRAAYAWAALSRATHHQCYEIAPTAAELRALHSEVTALLQLLDETAASEDKTSMHGQRQERDDRGPSLTS